MPNSLFTVKVVPPEQMRYASCDDYTEQPDGSVLFTIADTGSLRSNLLVLVHALVEYALVEKAKIPLSLVDAWDMTRPDDDDTEPGDDPQSPYHKQHMLASAFERIVSDGLREDWFEHEARIDAAVEKAAQAQKEKADVQAIRPDPPEVLPKPGD